MASQSVDLTMTDIIDLTFGDDSGYDDYQDHDNEDNSHDDDDDEGVGGGDDDDEDNDVFAVPDINHQQDMPIFVAHGRDLESFKNSFDVILRRNTNYELVTGQFVRIVRLVQCLSTKHITVQCHLLCRTSTLENMLQKACNELVLTLQVLQGGGEASPDPNHHLSVVLPDDIRCKREIVFTNCSLSTGLDRTFDHSFRDSYARKYPGQEFRDAEEHVRENEVLVCRWKYIEYLNPITMKRTYEGALMHLSEGEADTLKKVPDIQKTINWHHRYISKDTKPQCSRRKRPVEEEIEEIQFKRIKKTGIDGAVQVQETLTRNFNPYGKTLPTSHLPRFGSSLHLPRFGSSSHLPRFGSSSHFPRSASPSRPDQDASKITYGDICCGAGGWTGGAVDAGVTVKFGIDNDQVPLRTWKKNNPKARALAWDLNEFCQEDRRWQKVAVVHVSFPCQWFSPAKRGPSKDDVNNEIAILSIIDILKRTRARVVTFEETWGLYERHPADFRRLLHNITCAGYSVRWKPIRPCEFGNAQKNRKRLIMIASCPGEPLPPFPKPTHGPPGSGLRAFTTINDALRLAAGVRVGPRMLESTPKTATPYDGNIQLTGTITTSGGPSDLHPNGSQTFNCHQLAVLAGFSPYYKWDTAAPKTRLRKMIGNAVCMMLSKAVVESVVKSVKKRDLEIMEFNSEVIEIDDDLPVVVLDD